MPQIELADREIAQLIQDVGTGWRASCETAARSLGRKGITKKVYRKFAADATICFVDIARLTLAGHNVRLVITDAPDGVDLVKGVEGG